MIKNYLKVALRNLWKHKGYTFINALGLSIGIGSSLFIIAIVQYEYSFDDYHVNKDRIYRLTDRIQVGPGSIDHAASAPYAWAPVMHNNYPEIENYVRFVPEGHVVRHGENLFNETIFYVDPAVFEVFTYPLIGGDPETALIQPNSIVLTTEMAEKYFGQEDPVGQVLNFDNTTDYTVTGVINNVPNNSYLRFNFLASTASYNVQNFPGYENWRSHYTHTYFLLSENASPAAIEARFPEFIDTYIEEQYRERYRPSLQPLKDIHLNTGLTSEWGDNLDIIYIYIFSAIGFFVLLIACINFINITTGRSAGRAKEIGIRKVIGAYRTQLAKQLLAETFILTVIATFFGLILVEFALPWFQTLTQREVSIDYFDNIFYLFSVVSIIVLVSVMAGGYPAFFLSSMRPVIILKGEIATGMKGSSLRKVLVVTQFCLAVFMIIANIILFQQIGFMQNKDLGFDKENVMVFSRPPNISINRMMNIKNDLLSYPNISTVALSSVEPGDGYAYGRFIPEGSDALDGMMLPHIAVGEDYFEAFEIELIRGRNFSLTTPTDTNSAVIINEAAAREFRWNDPLGKRIEWLNAGTGQKSRTVIGVVKDFHFESLHSPIRPLIIHFSPDMLNLFLIKANPEEITAASEYVQERWKTYDPERPAFFSFLDEDLADEYELENIMGSLLIKFTILTIFLACLGLLGLAAFTSEQRTREIGIRKVFGASVPGILYLLSREFLKYVLISNLIAWPLSYIAMSMYLREFAYRTDIGIKVFVASGIVSLSLAWITVSFQAVRAACAKPVDSLRHE